jgi:uncharacterized protein
MRSRTAISLLEPKLILQGSILELTPSLLARHGLKGLVLDVDDTIIATRSSAVPTEVEVWIDEVRQIVQIALVSNNLSHARIRRIAGVLGLPYLFGAGKPSRKKVRQAVLEMDLPFHEVGMVGDRLFTDVLVGNRLGMFSILVEPMAAQTNTRHHRSCLRSFEIWLSRLLGATLKTIHK